MPSSFSPEHSMSDDEFMLLRDCVYKHCGIFFDLDSKYILEKRLSYRLTELNLSTFYDYCHYLKCHCNKEHELMDIMNVLTTNETYFFRESYQLKTFTDEIIPELIKSKTARRSHTLRIWSAGCSTGEEPYTIAMLLSKMPELAGWNIEIIATDISQKVLQHARQAVYSNPSFRATEQTDLQCFFRECDGGYKIADSIKKMVTICHLNLFDSSMVTGLGKFDLIFCRNVIIYFDSAAKKKVVESLYSSLYDGGFLLLGHSESLMNITALFTLRHFKHDMIYQRPDLLLAGGVL